MSWNDLSMADRARYIQWGVANGLSRMDDIRSIYNSYEDGGPKPRPDIEKSIAEYYDGIPQDAYPVHVVQDNNFNPPGYGDIETMLREDALYDGGAYKYPNPYPDENTIVFNNRVPDPEQAAILDYLHVLRAEDNQYKELLGNLHNSVMSDKGGLQYTARERRNEDAQRVGEENVLPLSRYIENEEDGWLRNMFHPGTREDLERDNYYPDKKQMLQWNPELYEPTREIYNYLHPYVLPEVTVTAKKDKKHKYSSGGSTSKVEGEGEYDLKGYTPVDVTSPIPVYIEDETGNMYYVSHGKMTNVSSVEEARKLYDADTERPDDKVQAQVNAEDPYKDVLAETARLSQESDRLREDSYERAERARERHNHEYLAAKSNDTIARENARAREIERGEELIHNALEEASKPVFSSAGVTEAVRDQEFDRREKAHMSLNAANAVITGLSIAFPELTVMNGVMSGAGVLQDIRDGNNVQTALGILGLLAPASKAWNPSIRRSTTTMVGGRPTTRIHTTELGTPLFWTNTVAGLGGDIYGAVVDDGVFNKIVK